MALSLTTAIDFMMSRKANLRALDCSHAKPCQRLNYLIIILLVACLTGCTGFTHKPLDEIGFQERAETQSKENIQVTAAVLSAEESKDFFGANLYQKSIQPIWLEVTNDNNNPVWYFPAGSDRNYFSPLEVVYINRSGYSKEGLRDMGWHFHNNAMGYYVGPGETRSGFIFTNLDLGTKGFNVDLIGEDHKIRSFTFFISVPGLRVDHQDVDFENLYSEDEIIDLDEAGLRKAIQQLPCCTTDIKGNAQGEPINLVIIAEGIDLHRALIRSGWNETASTEKKSASKATKSYPGIKKYSPVSPRYFYKRPQDAALRKSRKTLKERSVLRLWLSPMRVNGTPVLLGQISDSIADTENSDEATNQKTNIDEDRFYLTQDLMYSQTLQKTAQLKAYEAATLSEPGKTYHGARYVTDGYRRVIWITSDPVSYDEIEFLEWDVPTPQQEIIK